MTVAPAGRRSVDGVDSRRRPLEVVALSGSLRRGSLNTRLLNEARRLAPDGMHIELFVGLEEIPHFNEDLELPAPAPAKRLRERVRAADGLLIATPEYNASIPGALKNAIDWLSRPDPAGAQALPGMPVAIMGASKGPFGSIRSQVALRQVLQKTGAHVVAQPEVAVPFGDQNLAEAPPSDSALGTLVTQLLTELNGLIQRSQVSAS